ncbi:hypothetical protein [Maricaulis sp.]|uniref:hypothetical protein n=1 Tax=Maricaulis sp. TaxID=1486257 RepID=UPI001B2C6FAD|nr:hypothetical protein [Maricaulis sp.]MBO6796878.1 hypothetical protein [Maricaulis sp.]
MPIRDWAVSTGSIAAILVTSALVPVSAAHAQEDAIAHCRTAATAEARIACLEEALRAEPAAETTADRGETAAPEPGRRGFRLPGLPFGGRDNDDEQAVSTATSDSAATVPQAEGLGSEQVNARRTNRRSAQEAQREAEQVQSAIISFDIIPYERLEVTLANGQVWRQISADNQRVAGRLRRSRSYTATVREGVVGGYQLRINEISRIIRVERIR